MKVRLEKENLVVNEKLKMSLTCIRRIMSNGNYSRRTKSKIAAMFFMASIRAKGNRHAI